MADFNRGSPVRSNDASCKDVIRLVKLTVRILLMLLSKSLLHCVELIDLQVAKDMFVIHLRNGGNGVQLLLFYRGVSISRLAPV